MSTSTASAPALKAIPGITFDGGMTIAFQVKDRKKSIEWYETNLGFRLLYDVEPISWCEMASSTPGVNFGFSQVQSPKTGAGPVPTLGVKNIDSARKSLESRGVRFDGETHTIPGMVKLATFFDPDGNALMLFQDLQKH